MKFVDIGINLTNPQFHSDFQEVAARANAASVDRLILTGTSLASSRAALTLAEQLGAGCYSTAGIHPHDAGEWQENSYLELKQLFDSEKVVAVGETGLDFNRKFSTEEHQIEAFAQQIQLAVEINKPMFLHEREASSALIELIKPNRDNLVNAVVHCFTGTEAELKQYLDLDLFIGITGWICDERRGLELQRLVQYIPLNRLMIETDAPFLLPRDLTPKPKNKRNEPAYLPHIAERIAYFRGEKLTEVASQIYGNSCQFFNLPTAS